MKIIENMLESLNEWLLTLLKGIIEWNLDQTSGFFGHSVKTVQQNVSETPTEFSATLVDSLRLISDTAILPVAGLILTYIFCYELYQLVTDKNRGNDFEVGLFIFLIIKTSGMILLMTNSFDITLAIFDVGKWITNKIPSSVLVIPNSINETILNSINSTGPAIGLMFLTFIILGVTFFMTGIIYLVAWSRIITILLYISIAPLPFATFMNKDWIGSIGQNYVKQLLALMLQGYFMIVCLVVYAGLLEKVSAIMFEESRPMFALLLMLVSMGILVITLTRTHSLAKSVVGVV